MYVTKPAIMHTARPADNTDKDELAEGMITRAPHQTTTPVNPEHARVLQIEVSMLRQPRWPSLAQSALVSSSKFTIDANDTANAKPP